MNVMQTFDSCCGRGRGSLIERRTDVKSKNFFSRRVCKSIE
jgi:hypothetical protein